MEAKHIQIADLLHADVKHLEVSGGDGNCGKALAGCHIPLGELCLATRLSSSPQVKEGTAVVHWEPGWLLAMELLTSLLPRLCFLGLWSVGLPWEQGLLCPPQLCHGAEGLSEKGMGCHEWGVHKQHLQVLQAQGPGHDGCTGWPFWVVKYGITVSFKLNIQNVCTLAIQGLLLDKVVSLQVFLRFAL